MDHWQTASWAPSDRVEQGLAVPAPHGELRGDEVHICPSPQAAAWGAWGWSGEVASGDGRGLVRRVVVHVVIGRPVGRDHGGDAA